MKDPFESILGFVPGWGGAILLFSIPFLFLSGHEPWLQGPRLVAVAIGLHTLAIAAGVWSARRKLRRQDKKPS